MANERGGLMMYLYFILKMELKEAAFLRQPLKYWFFQKISS